MAALPVLTSLTYVGAGLMAWTRRPHNRMGPLPCAGGLAWIGWGLRAADVPFLAAVGLLCEAVPFAVLVHLLLAFPSGRLGDRPERLVVAAGYLSVPLVHAPTELLGASRDDGILVLDVVDDPGVADVALAIQAVANGALLLAAAVLVVRRLRAADPAWRRLAAPLNLCGLLALAVIALLDVLDGAGFTAVGGWPVDLLNALGIVVVVLLPLAFLAGTLMGGFARSGELVRLGDAPVGPAQLGAAVAYALGDPSAEIIYWLSDERRYVDASGAAVDPDPSRAWRR